MLEKTDMNAKLLEQNRESNQSTNHISDRPHHRKPQRRFQARQNNAADRAHKQREHDQSSRKCCNCGGPFPHKEGKLSCPARGKKCHACGKLGLFAKHCLSKAQQNHQCQRQSCRQEGNEVTQTCQDYLDDTDEEFAYVINSIKH